MRDRRLCMADFEALGATLDCCTHAKRATPAGLALGVETMLKMASGGPLEASEGLCDEIHDFLDRTFR